MLVCFPSEDAARAALLDLEVPVGGERDQCLTDRIKVVVARHGGGDLPSDEADRAGKWVLDFSFLADDK